MTSPLPGGGEPFFLFSGGVYRESIRVGPAGTADVDTVKVRVPKSKASGE